MFMNPDMRAFDIEAAALHAFEHRFNLPPHAVHLQCLFGIAVRDEYLQFWLALLVLDLGSGKIARLAVDVVDTIKMFRFAQLQIVEEPVGLEFTAMSDDMEVLAYPDMVVDASGVEISEPFVADELPVSHEMGDRVLTGKAHEAVNESDTFGSIGVASLVHHRVYDREGHAVIYDAKGEDVYVGVAELPVGPVHGKIVWALYRDQL